MGIPATRGHRPTATRGASPSGIKRWMTWSFVPNTTVVICPGGRLSRVKNPKFGFLGDGLCRRVPLVFSGSSEGHWRAPTGLHNGACERPLGPSRGDRSLVLLDAEEQLLVSLQPC